MKKLLCIVFVLNAIFANAQSTETLSSDRPGQALSVNTVGKNIFQIQTGIDFFNNANDFYPSSYFRYGLSERFELNSGFVLSSFDFSNDLASFTIGARYNLNSKGSKYQSSLQYSYGFGSGIENSQLTYILGSSFTEKLSYTANLGVRLRDDFTADYGIYIFNLTYALNNKMGLFIEPFGVFTSNNYQLNFDTGFYYLLNNNFQLDAVIGGNNGLFTGAGFTWRIPSKSKKEDY